MKTVLQKLVLKVLNNRFLMSKAKVTGDFTDATLSCHPGVEMSIEDFQDLVINRIKYGQKSFVEEVKGSELVRLELDDALQIKLLTNQDMVMNIPYVGNLLLKEERLLNEKNIEQ